MHRYIVPELWSPIALVAADVRVITPTKAIARSLKVPHYSLEALARSIVHRQGKRIASALFGRRCLQDAVREVIETKDVEGTAGFFLSTIRELFQSGVDLSALQTHPSSRIQQLGILAANYRQRLRDRHCIDPGELFWQGASEVVPQKSYFVYGYFSPRRDELVFIDAIAGNNSTLVLPVGEIEREEPNLFTYQRQAVFFLENRQWELVYQPQTEKTANYNHIGSRLQQCFTHSPSLPPEASLHCYPNNDAEVRGVLTQVKALLSQQIRARDIVLVARDEQLYGETIIDIAWEFDLTVRVLYEIPLEQTRIGAWLKLLLEVIADDFPFEATAKLLSHPLARYLTGDLWVQARHNHPQGYQSWQELGVDLSLLHFTRSRYRRDVWIQRLQNILTGWEILEKGNHSARETVAFYRLQEALVELAQPEGEIISKQTFIRDLQETLALLTVPAQPGRGGVELHTPTSLCGTKYPYVFVLGMAEGILPTAIAPERVLDFSTRKQLAQQGWGITTAVEIAHREALNFYHLLRIPTQAVTFSYPQLIANQTILPSPYLSRLGLKASSVDSLPLASIEVARQVYLRHPHQFKDPLMPQITKAWQVETNRESAIAPDRYDGVIGIGIAPNSKIFSASQLTQLGQCPFKWFSSRLLKLKALTEAESDLSVTFRGNLYHRCLELSLAEIKTAADLEQFNHEQLAKAFRQAEQELQLTQLPGWDAQRQEHLDLLMLNAIADEFLPPDREIVARETEFQTEWYGLRVRGTVDRIDRTDKGLTIIDYKTSGVTPAGIKDETGKANLDIQLSLYQDAIAQFYPDEPIEGAIYYSLTKQKTLSRPKRNPEELAAFAERVKFHLEQGHYPVAPDIERKACRYCDFDLVCRQGNRLSRKNL